jgi:hypothetical protein
VARLRHREGASIVIPWREGAPGRREALDWIASQHSQNGYKVVIAEPEVVEPWCKADAVMPAVEASDGCVIVADADVWVMPAALASAVRAVTVGAASWAVPHKMVYRLNKWGTERWYKGLMPAKRKMYDRKPYVGVLGGGIVVAHRDTLLDVPLDRRFKGPGHEDEAWGIALRTLLGEPWRGTAPLYHLWHEPMPRLSHRRGSIENWKMYVQYAEARGHADTIRMLLKDAR